MVLCYFSNHFLTKFNLFDEQIKSYEKPEPFAKIRENCISVKDIKNGFYTYAPNGDLIGGIELNSGIFILVYGINSQRENLFKFMLLPQLKYSTAAKVLVTSAIAYQAVPLISRQFNKFQLFPFITRNMSTQSQFIPPQAPPSWNHSSEEILKLTEDYIKRNTELNDKIAKLVDNPTVENAFQPIATFDNENDGLINVLTFYQHVSANKELRDASTQSEQKFRDFGIEQSLREDLYKVFHKLYQETANYDSLTEETKKYLKDIDNDYRRNGLALSEEKRNQIKEIQKKLSNLSLEFGKNLGEQQEFILFTKEELDGVPQDVIDQFEKTEDDKLKMTFKYPDIFPVLKYAKNEETRKKAFIGDQNKVPQNEPLLIETVKLRSELSQLLGYENFAEYVLEKKMAKNSKTVLSFLDDLKKKLTPLALKEREHLLALKNEHLKEQGLPESKSYNVWDHRFYDTLLLEREYKVDQQKISEYFPIKETIDKMLGIFSKLMNLKFIESSIEEKSVWHEDVKQFAVWNLDDSSNPKFVGWLYFDLHPRDGKYGHAANFGIYPGYNKTDGSRAYPVTALVCNFSKPTKDKPSLLKHDEVTTFFHELGHGIHDLVGNTEYGKYHGPSGCSWDFVEAPSQMLEYWTWSKDELRDLSSHYKTGDKIDDELIDSLIRSKHVNGGLFNLRQLHFGLFDMTLHSKNESIDIAKFWNESRESIALVSSGGEITKGFNSFNHIMGGYQAGYYGYLWSQVFAADIYYTKFKSNPLDNKVGVQYRDIILARGGSKEENYNLRELLGREPNNEAFSKELGLSA
ncbi:saccharolysin [Wickerhamomyces ciferrii]|uniref:Saccharolysin n=1 Tax=Wickerhamomyces ciferrii (strain ATCC 14091 / BCRC 22168 / CBS 111 / JCM 3599 / NBRC 0793 / NRRL Y-1031 F-60-10) TaxID=1206466 RepID=K0L075_WICCF|nr:saccharolysin [Wickerhamomyces ciferrii]CCH47014.1 saccharolysin [Wickerhamomyces ciferrii]